MFDSIIRRLISEASKSDMNYKHACAIIKRGKILSIGYNRHRHYMCIHAEASVMGKYRWRSGCNAIIIRVNTSGGLSNSYPCNVCLELLRDMGIRRIWYSMDDSLVKANVNKMPRIHVSSGYRYNNSI